MLNWFCQLDYLLVTKNYLFGNKGLFTTGMGGWGEKLIYNTFPKVVHGTMATWCPGSVKPCHMGQQFWQESLWTAHVEDTTKQNVPTQFWPESLQNTDNFGDHRSKWEDYIKMCLNWISTLADKLTNNEIKKYKHFQKEHIYIYKIWKVLHKEIKGKCREKHGNKLGTKMVRNMSFFFLGKNTRRNETGSL